MEQVIGYRLKRLDQLIENTFDRVLAAEGVSRRQWQTLNVLRRTPANNDEIGAALQPFWDADAMPAAEVVEELTRRGWITRDSDGRHTLTPEGRAAHAALATSVGGIRETMSRGLTEQEYRTTMDVLGRMIDNLESAAHTGTS